LSTRGIATMLELLGSL